jgi:hypothetical protein
MRKPKAIWNGQDFYVNFGDGTADGEGKYRSWDDALKFGFVTAGGGRWYSKPLENLQPGSRVFVNIPKHGFVGVGTVTATAVPIREFTVKVDGKQIPYLDASPSFEDVDAVVANADDPEMREIMVRVEWIKAVPKTEAFWEKGMFANQSSVCKLRNRFTLEHLAQHFELNE